MIKLTVIFGVHTFDHNLEWLTNLTRMVSTVTRVNMPRIGGGTHVEDEEAIAFLCNRCDEAYPGEVEDRCCCCENVFCKGCASEMTTIRNKCNGKCVKGEGYYESDDEKSRPAAMSSSAKPKCECHPNVQDVYRSIRDNEDQCDICDRITKHRVCSNCLAYVDPYAVKGVFFKKFLIKHSTFKTCKEARAAARAERRLEVKEEKKKSMVSNAAAIKKRQEYLANKKAKIAKEEAEIAEEEEAIAKQQEAEILKEEAAIEEEEAAMDKQLEAERVRT